MRLGHSHFTSPPTPPPPPKNKTKQLFVTVRNTTCLHRFELGFMQLTQWCWILLENLSDVQPVRFPHNPKLNTMFGLKRIQCIFFPHRFFAITLPSVPNVHQSDVSFSDLRISDLSHCHIPTRRFPPAPFIYINSWIKHITDSYFSWTSILFLFIYCVMVRCSLNDSMSVQHLFSPSKVALNAPLLTFV